MYAREWSRECVETWGRDIFIFFGGPSGMSCYLAFALRFFFLCFRFALSFSFFFVRFCCCFPTRILIIISSRRYPHWTGLEAQGGAPSRDIIGTTPRRRSQPGRRSAATSDPDVTETAGEYLVHLAQTAAKAYVTEGSSHRLPGLSSHHHRRHSVVQMPCRAPGYETPSPWDPSSPNSRVPTAPTMGSPPSHLCESIRQARRF